ncbi:conserved hypothetical protein, partial [Trichinella spiralis]|uniref:hypothetical protein n=1 Tax=Trichinella spiralis TaxID=6334 RepID=UPI0001EFD254
MHHACSLVTTRRLARDKEEEVKIPCFFLVGRQLHRTTILTDYWRQLIGDILTILFEILFILKAEPYYDDKCTFAVKTNRLA